ncbi:PLP-dependent aminotransferase family protein [Methylobacterium brachythecii]|uniref:8-amino-7-oxononanoate synthase n=1 Tax=Methylobacterium brachythecii TaxID=1176177 RepID=A0A7W6AMT4_9HYPH|nr:PLP-dependent aminotransferase family protein [Methylobacterium brachythecii]MBB3904109.1 DNA-binding transcriptional MocR family regulator [Methylobacterium brachythecii]GLS42850.1 transcriptional regulator [Methylobacterium brachythecii]
MRPVWTETIERIAGPRYLAIVNAIELALQSGALRPGDRLPPQRDLAGWLSLNTGTIGKAYAEMHRTGLARGEVGRGTFLNEAQASDGPSSLGAPALRRTFIDLSHNFPPNAMRHPALDVIRPAFADAVDVGGLLASQVDIGLPRHRAVAARWLGRFGIEATADNMLVTCGGQHGLLLALMALTRPGDAVLSEELCFYGLKSAAAMLGRSLVGVRMDREGIVPDYLDVVCRRTGAKVLFCTPTLHNPTTATMSEDRRREVAEICSRHDVLIVEDDVYGFLPDPQPLPLAAMAPDRVVHISSLSKLVGPGLRIGFMRAPSHLAPAFGKALRASTLMASPFNAEYATRLLSSPQLDEVVAGIRSETAARQALVADVLPEPALMTHPQAYHFCLKLKNGWSAEAYTQAAEKLGVGVTPLSLFEVSALHQSDSVRVCVNAASDRISLTAALAKLSELLREGAPADVRYRAAV